MARTREATINQALPAIGGRNLNGREVELPRDLAGRGGVLVLGFSPLAAPDDEAWARWIAKRLHGRLPVYLVVVVEGPRFLSPVVEGMLKRRADERLYPFALIRFDPKKCDRKRFGLVHDARALVLLVDARGHIRWESDAGFSEAEAARLEAAIEASSPP